MRNGEVIEGRRCPLGQPRLRWSKPFATCWRSTATELELLLITQAVSRGEVLMREGDAADALYLVASGRSIAARNVPVKSMRALKSGPNVVIGLKSDELRGDTADYAALPSRGRMLRQLLNPFARRQLPPRPRRGYRAPAQPDGAARAPVELARARRPADQPPAP